MTNSSVPQFRRDRIEAARRAAEEPQGQTPPATVPQPDENGLEPQVDPNKEANDAAAWKGRLTKTQEELRAEREERNRIAVEALTAQNRAKEAEERAQQAQRQLEEASRRLEAYQQKEKENFLSEEEKRQLSDTFGDDATDLLTKILAKTRPATPPVDVNAEIDKRFQDMTAKTLEKEWASSVRSQIPEAHTLRADEDFIQYASSKTDWFGNTALSVMDDIGAKRDVSRIGFIVNLISEYKASKNQTQGEPVDNPTVPPRNTTPAYTRPSGNGKKKVSSEEFHIKLNQFKVRGDTKGLREYLAGHEEAN